MFDNPLYGSMGKSHGRCKDQDHQQKDHLTAPEVFACPSKPADGDPDRPPVPTPRNRSFTCSETKPQPSMPSTLLPLPQKKPVVPSRSEGGIGKNRPPLPAKSRPGIPEPQAPKPRDYRESSELPSKLRLPARPGQPQSQKDSKWGKLLNCFKLQDKYNVDGNDDARNFLWFSLVHPEVPKMGRPVMWGQVAAMVDITASCPAFLERSCTKCSSVQFTRSAILLMSGCSFVDILGNTFIFFLCESEVKRLNSALQW